MYGDLVDTLAACGIVAVTLIFFYSSGKLQYLLFAVLAILFFGSQMFARRSAYRPGGMRWNCLFQVALAAITLMIPVVAANSLVLCFAFVTVIPLYIVASGEIERMPRILLLTCSVLSLAVLIDLYASRYVMRFELAGEHLSTFVIGIPVCYLLITVLLHAGNRRRTGVAWNSRMNFSTQYSLVISSISAVVIACGMMILISQIRGARLEQVGRNYQAIAQNFARLAGSHLEQQVHSLKFLTQQVPIFQATLRTANARYTHSSKEKVHQLHQQWDVLWNQPIRKNRFVIGYLDQPVVKALSDFRGRNSFHNDLVLVDRFGGLVGNLGPKPDHIYVEDQDWWHEVWNNGLGNSFIGELTWVEGSEFPWLRLAVEIIDNSSNRVVGCLSSMYLLRTMIEDMERFKPETVGMITLLDADGRVIAGSGNSTQPGTMWSGASYEQQFGDDAKARWALGKDLEGKPALIGYSSLSTEYSVISDPLQRLHWYVAVSGTRADALADVTRSTKVALFYGLLAMACGVLVAIFTARVITRPIKNLTEVAIVMGDGDLDKRAEPEGPLELVALARSLNRLTGRLKQVIDNLQARTDQLAKAKSEAETATRRKGEFLATMSHEIRTPLNAILGFTDIMESSASSEATKRYTKIIKNSGADLLNLVNDILDLSKIEAGRMELELEPVSVSGILEDLQRLFSVTIERKGIVLDLDVSPGLPSTLVLDGKRFKQILFNLIGNAVKFTDHGRVTCRVKGEPNATSGYCRLIVTVRDTGPGIDIEEQQKIFESFHQQRGYATGIGESTGLGLAITRSLVEMMQGVIEVESEPGLGALFTVVLPGVEVGEREVGEAEQPDSGVEDTLKLGPAVVLVVDDLDINRHLVAETLKHHAVTIFQADNGIAALECIQERRFDLVLLDIRMPGLDGFATLEQINEMPGGRPFPVIAITASGMRDEIARIKEAGFDAHLLRPFTSAALVEMVARHLPHKSGKKGAVVP